MTTDRCIQEHELDAALRQALMRPVPVDLARTVRVAVACEASRHRRRHAMRRRLLMPEFRLALAGMLVGVVLARVPRADRADNEKNVTRMAAGSATSSVGAGVRRLDKPTLSGGPSRSRAVDTPPAAQWTTVSRHTNLVEAARPAIWIEEPVPALPASARSESTGKLTNRVIISDELRNERTSYIVTREIRDGTIARVDVRVEKNPMYESPQEEKKDETSYLPVGSPVHGHAVAGADRAAAKVGPA